MVFTQLKRIIPLSSLQQAESMLLAGTGSGRRIEV